jgi:hypothetical protein
VESCAGLLRTDVEHLGKCTGNFDAKDEGKQMNTKPTIGLLCVLASIALVACSTEPQLGGGPTMVTGSSNLYGGVGQAPQLVQCDKPLGTATLVEAQKPDPSEQSPIVLMRLLMQQSHCFLVVDRGQAMQNIMQERSLEHSGELRQSSNFGGGQMVAADFSISPNVVFAQKGSKGTASGLGFLSMGASAIPYVGLGAPLIGAVGLASQSTTNEAQATLSVTDNRSALQIAMAEGSASNQDIAGVAGIFGGYTNTDKSKIIAAALLDAYNKMVTSLKTTQYAYRSQPGAVYQPQEKASAPTAP